MTYGSMDPAFLHLHVSTKACAAPGSVYTTEAWAAPGHVYTAEAERKKERKKERMYIYPLYTE
jgi:hypothetical protein